MRTVVPRDAQPALITMVFYSYLALVFMPKFKSLWYSWHIQPRHSFILLFFSSPSTSAKLSGNCSDSFVDSVSKSSMRPCDLSIVLFSFLAHQLYRESRYSRWKSCQSTILGSVKESISSKLSRREGRLTFHALTALDERNCRRISPASGVRITRS